MAASQPDPDNGSEATDVADVDSQLDAYLIDTKIAKLTIPKQSMVKVKGEGGVGKR